MASSPDPESKTALFAILFVRGRGVCTLGREIL